MSGGDPAATAFVEVFVAVWIILFLASFVVGVVRLVLWARRVRSIAELRRTGQRVTAQVTKISRESAFIARDYRTVWYIEADWTNLKTGISYRLKSDPLGRRRAKPYARGELTGVLVDPADPNRYYVERAH